MLTSLTIEIEADVLAMWAAEAAVSGLSLAEWAKRRIAAVEVSPRSRVDVAARRAGFQSRPLCQPRAVAAPVAAAVAVADDDEVLEDEVEVAAPKVAVARRRAGTQPKDLAGKVFGRLTAVRVVGRNKAGYCLWLCACSCGGEKTVDTSSLTAGFTKSCGCLRGRREGPRAKSEGSEG